MINRSTRTIAVSSESSDTSVEYLRHQGKDQGDGWQLKEPYLFNPQVCERVTSGEEDEAIFSKFEPSECRLKLHSDLLKRTEDHKERKAMFVTDPPKILMFMKITYYGRTADEKEIPCACNVTGSSRGVTVHNVLQAARGFPLSLSFPAGVPEIKEILLDNVDTIWVTAAEKLKVENEGQVTIPKPTVVLSGWAGEVAEEGARVEVKEEDQVWGALPVLGSKAKSNYQSSYRSPGHR